MCMKVMFIFIDRKLRIVYKYICLYHAYCYLHHLCDDDVDVTAYEYVNVYADGYENDNDSCYYICVCI